MKKPRNNLTVVSPSEPPPIKYGAFYDFGKTVNRIDSWSDDIDDAISTLRCPTSSSEDREQALEIADGCDLEHGDDIEEVAKCKAFAQMFDHPGNYDASGQLRTEILARRLAMLIGGFPTGPRNLEDFSTQLLSEVEGIQPNMIVLESACRWIIRKMKFVPTVNEIIEIIGDHDELWEHRWQALDTLQERKRKLVELAATLRR